MPRNFVLIRAYNSQDFIVNTIENALTSLKNSVVFVLDDGSTDKTADIVKTMQKTYPENIILYRQKNQGVAGALRTGFTQLSQLADDDDNIFVLDSDDEFCTDIIGKAPEKLEEAAVCYIPFKMTGTTNTPSTGPSSHQAQCKILSKESSSITSYSTKKQKSFAKNIGIGYPLKAIKGHVLKRYVKHVLPYFEKGLGLGEDIPNFLYALFTDVKITALNEVGYNYIRRNDSVTGTLTPKTIKENMDNLSLMFYIIAQCAPSDVFVPDARQIAVPFAQRITEKLRGRVTTMKDPNFTIDDFNKRYSSFTGGVVPAINKIMIARGRPPLALQHQR